VARVIGTPSAASFSQSISRRRPVSDAKRPSSVSQRRSSALRSASGHQERLSHFSRSFPEGHIRDDEFLQSLQLGWKFRAVSVVVQSSTRTSWSPTVNASQYRARGPVNKRHCQVRPERQVPPPRRPDIPIPRLHWKTSTPSRHDHCAFCIDINSATLAKRGVSTPPMLGTNVPEPFILAQSRSASKPMTTWPDC
jgi:hypothetical protein